MIIFEILPLDSYTTYTLILAIFRNIPYMNLPNAMTYYTFLLNQILTQFQRLPIFDTEETDSDEYLG